MGAVAQSAVNLHIFRKQLASETAMILQYFTINIARKCKLNTLETLEEMVKRNTS